MKYVAIAKIGETKFDLFFEEKPVSKLLEMRVSGELLRDEFSDTVSKLCWLADSGFDGRSNGDYVFRFDERLPIKFILKCFDCVTYKPEE